VNNALILIPSGNKYQQATRRLNAVPDPTDQQLADLELEAAGWFNDDDFDDAA
jgi:hypothetical protein